MFYEKMAECVDHYFELAEEQSPLTTLILAWEEMLDARYPLYVLEAVQTSIIHVLLDFGLSTDEAEHAFLLSKFPEAVRV